MVEKKFLNGPCQKKSNPKNGSKGLLLSQETRYTSNFFGVY